MKAITAGKKKSDRLDARTIADLLRCNLLPTCYVLSPQMRDLRRLLRYRHLVVTQSVRMQNKIAGLLMESGAPFVKAKLRGKKYFHELVQALEEVPESVQDLLKMSRGAMELFEATQKQLIRRLLSTNPSCKRASSAWRVSPEWARSRLLPGRSKSSIPFASPLSATRSATVA